MNQDLPLCQNAVNQNTFFYCIYDQTNWLTFFFLIGNISTFNFEIEQFIIYHQIFACTLQTQIKIKKNKSEILLIYFMISIHIYYLYKHAICICIS